MPVSYSHVGGKATQFTEPMANCVTHLCVNVYECACRENYISIYKYD